MRFAKPSNFKRGEGVVSGRNSGNFHGRAMKLISLIIIGFGFFGVAHAAPLAEEETVFIGQMIGAVTVQAFCPEYEVVPNAAEAIGDRMGVGGQIQSAIIAAYAQTLDNQPFNRAYLIPEVTRQVNMVMRLLEQKRQDNNLCALGPAYAKRGWIRLKGH